MSKQIKPQTLVDSLHVRPCLRHHAIVLVGVCVLDMEEREEDGDDATVVVAQRPALTDLDI